ncbi:MAG: sigma 54-interacting transcriptional regulator [Deltaproteobacteria bacterium]|nr:sigma 54-interacting transcriptional regulator [Deltaproteobacteria bacterium]
MAQNPTHEELEQRVKLLESELQDLKELEDALKESEESYRLLVEAAPSAITAIQDGNIIFTNSAGAKLLGFSDTKEMMGLSIKGLVSPEFQEVVAKRLKNLELGKRNPTAEIKLVRQDGTKITVESTSIPKSFQKKTIGVIVAHDITERKLTQERLLESETKYRTLTEHAPDGIFLVDATTGQFLDCNTQGLKMFGYSREKMLSFTPVDFSPPVAPDGRPVPEVLQERLESLTPDKQIVFEWVHLHADGHEIPCEIRAVLLPSSDRHMLRASMVDITKRKRAEEALEERFRFQELITKISTKFIGLSGVEFEQAIQDTLAVIGRYFDVDSVRLYRLSLQGDIIEMRNVWRSEYLISEEETTEMHKMKYPHLAAHYSQGETIVYGCPDECPPLPDLIEILKYAKIKAGVGVPLEIDDSGIDVFAFAKTQSEHEWPKNIIEYCKVIGQIILSAMRRRETEIELKDRHTEIKKLKDRLEQENIYLREEIEINYRHDEIIGDSEGIKRVLTQAEKVADQETSVLILGETGTGKELLAHAIHNMSQRKNRAMIKVNCAALPSTLIESELFGREKGAFTGAVAKQIGRFEAAHGSTIFLDEIGDLPIDLQAKLLRVLHEGEFELLGSTKTVSVDVRVIAATNHDLETAIHEGRFRQDLFYRLNVFPITIPPLRERREDIPLLVWEFVKELGESMGRSIEKVPKKSMDMLQKYTWPGNVRELRNVIERAMILSARSTLIIDRLEPKDPTLTPNRSLKEIERNHIVDVLESSQWRVYGKNGAAEILGLKPSTLQHRMKKLGIERPR